MSYPSIELRAALITHLKNSSPLVNQLGGAKIYDETPASTPFPYIHVGDWVVKDWSTDSEAAHEHLISLNIYARNGGKRDVEEILESVMVLLDDAPLSLTTHHLVNMRCIECEISREKDGRTYLANVKMRAMTERI